MFDLPAEIKIRRLTAAFLMVASAALGDIPKAELGLMDLRNAQLESKSVALAGQWTYFENQLLSPAEVIQAPRNYVSFPGAWNESRGTGSGFATYALNVLVPKEVTSLALEIPQIYSSYQLWVNGQSIAVNGKVGTTDADTQPQWMPQTVSFENPGDTLHLVLQISNFHHYLGGAKDPIFLGSSERLQQHRSFSVIGNLAESAMLALLAIGFFVTYFTLSARKSVILYFAMLCLTWAVRVGFSNLYVFISFMPDFDWNAMIKIEYMTLFFTMIWAILFFSRLFPKEENKFFRYFLVGSNTLFLAFTILSPPIMFTQWISVYLAFIAILLVYGIVIVLRAWINQRAGSTFLTISVLLGLVIFSYDVIAYKGFSTYDPVIFSISYMTLFSLMGVVLLKHLNIIKSTRQSISILTYKDLYK